jgi:8-oxo-dGTP pyrophosphatase MutT (NUDIX family)
MVQILARPASTIVVIRDQNAVLEILMLRRSSDVAAASGAHVFPGGAVDAVDADVVARGLAIGLDDETAARRLNLDSGAMTYYCAALRELFEEAGLLLAKKNDGRALNVENARLVAWRADLATGRVTWPELLEREGLRLAVGELQYLAH